MNIYKAFIIISNKLYVNPPQFISVKAKKAIPVKILINKV
jgi:hypothetical protein